MKIFISWSGAKSKSTAIFLKSWIEQIIQAVDPWISVDIDKGKKWNSEIIGELTESKVGIICLTKDNLDSPWILFESGALSKSKDSYVCTFLLDLRPVDVTGPLSIFQATTLNQEDIFKLLMTINKMVGNSGGKSLSIENLKSLYKRFYPELESKLKEIEKTNSKNKDKLVRTDRELLEESVQLMRRLEKSINYVDLEKEGKKLLDYYAERFAQINKLSDKWDVGTSDNIDKFISQIKLNPLLMKVFGSEMELRKYVERQFDGLPF